MRGLIFTEFLDLVTSRFSLRTLDAMLNTSRVRSGGSYTVVGSYDHRELHVLVQQLSTLTGQSVDTIMLEFGRHLFPRLAGRYPALLRPYQSTFAVIGNLDKVIHAPSTQLQMAAAPRQPSFECEQPTHDTLYVRYRSTRGMAALAHGLMQGCADFFNEQIRIERNDASDPQTCFLLTKLSVI